MKSTTHVIEITNQKNEKYQSEGRNPLACWPPHLLALCQLRNFPGEFTEKCFAVFDQSSCMIYLTWYWSLLLWSFLLWYGFKILVKSREGGYIFKSSIACKCLAEFFFFFFIWKLNILSFDGTILNLIQLKINKNCWNFHQFLKFLLFHPLYEFRILVQIYQSII